MYKIRVILDTKEDVIRTLSIREDYNLEQLHYAISNAFDFNGQEMASFYRTDYQWNQGEEIPLFSMAEAGEDISMASCILKETLLQENDKLIYVYDFLNMWTFYVELLEISQEEDHNKDTRIILSVGEIPTEAPKKEFKAEKSSDSFDDFNTDFENLDDLDFDNY